MLQTISWSQYFSFILLLMAFYYAWVGYKYYRWELLALIGISKIEPVAPAIHIDEFKQKLVPENPNDYLPKEPKQTPAIVQAIKDEISAYLQGSADSIITKEEIINSLQVIVAKYPATNLSGHNNSLHQFILIETDTIHPGIISPDDINRILPV